jgi:hypothetical protein
VCVCVCVRARARVCVRERERERKRARETSEWMAYVSKSFRFLVHCIKYSCSQYDLHFYFMLTVYCRPLIDKRFIFYLLRIKPFNAGALNLFFVLCESVPRDLRLQRPPLLSLVACSNLQGFRKVWNQRNVLFLVVRLSS